MPTFFLNVKLLEEAFWKGSMYAVRINSVIFPNLKGSFECLINCESIEFFSRESAIESANFLDNFSL